MPYALDQLLAVIEQHWGFRALRPLQEQAMRAVLEDRDSLVVMPTGGGKSLCFQAPAVFRRQTTVVISPLIALMKDQVDGLQACGVPAVHFESSQTGVERFAHQQEIRDGVTRLVFVSPERLINTDLFRVFQQAGVRTFAIDEAHCISHWGHDFRKEYRELSKLRQHFPEATFHAYTATATEQVRRDIVTQLGLINPEILVGNFDRPNLTYRVVPRRDLLNQTLEIIKRHPDEAGIIYCIRRIDVDELTVALRKNKVRALAYHAGLSPDERTRVQDEFINERCDLIVATVAFGMGIDRSNIRFVLHAAMPKSIEHYQQEAGRAGRDGLPAECVLLYSGADLLLWKSIVERSAAEQNAGPDFVASAVRHMDDMDRYSRGAVCRHRVLVGYFGQTLDGDNCEACDLCLDETVDVPEAVIVAQKILSCVARVNQGFGIGHVTSVLRGENTDNVRKRGHEKLSTYGLLKSHGKPEIRDWIYQLIGQGVLLQIGDEYPVLKLNAASWEVMRGQRSVRLVEMARGNKRERKTPLANVIPLEGANVELFEVLRLLRKQISVEIKKPPYIIFTDDVLRRIVQRRPSTLEKLRQISGVGETKTKQFGERFLKALGDHCRIKNLKLDVAPD
jgi:ATP-dependent DNA helicase RecQ